MVHLRSVRVGISAVVRRRPFEPSFVPARQRLRVHAARGPPSFVVPTATRTTPMTTGAAATMGGPESRRRVGRDPTASRAGSLLIANLRIANGFSSSDSLRPACVPSRSRRSLSASSDGGGGGGIGVEGLVRIDVDDQIGVATLTMDRPPANSLSLEMNEAISSSIKRIERDRPEVRGLVLASSHPRIFSAGLDVSELLLRRRSSDGYNGKSEDAEGKDAVDEDRLPRFWRSVQQLYLDLYGSPLATVAAVGGHAPAGGCMLAMACDHRVMSSSIAGPTASSSPAAAPKIGLNETNLGIAAPPWMIGLMVRTIGHRRTERATAMGTLFSPEAALDAGLVDEIVEPGRLQTRSRETAAEYAAMSPAARVATKMALRGRYLKELEDSMEEDAERFLEYVRRDEVQEGLEAYVDALRKRSGRKKG